MKRVPVFLVGMMGAGKSAVGPSLARRLGRRFVDADAEIERAAGRSIPEIFAAEGEAGFRARERETVDALARSADVIALGGGALTQSGAPERLAAQGILVYLRARPQTLVSRLGDCSTRPMLSGVPLQERSARLSALLAERAPAYATAELVVDTDDRAVADIAEEIACRLESRQSGAPCEPPPGASA